MHPMGPLAHFPLGEQFNYLERFWQVGQMDELQKLRLPPPPPARLESAASSRRELCWTEHAPRWEKNACLYMHVRAPLYSSGSCACGNVIL